MAFKAATQSWFALANASATLTVIQPYVDDVSIPQTTKMLDVSAIGTTPMAFIPGLSDGDKIAIKGPYDVAIWNQLTAMKAAQNAGTAGFAFMWGPGGSVSGQAKESGTVYLETFTTSANVAGRVDWSASLQVTGAVTNGTF